VGTRARQKGGAPTHKSKTLPERRRKGERDPKGKNVCEKKTERLTSWRKRPNKRKIQRNRLDGEKEGKGLDDFAQKKGKSVGRGEEGASGVEEIRGGQQRYSRKLAVSLLLKWDKTKM